MNGTKCDHTLLNFGANFWETKIQNTRYVPVHETLLYALLQLSPAVSIRLGRMNASAEHSLHGHWLFPNSRTGLAFAGTTNPPSLRDPLFNSALRPCFDFTLRSRPDTLRCCGVPPPAMQYSTQEEAPMMKFSRIISASARPALPASPPWLASTLTQDTSPVRKRGLQHRSYR